MEPKSMQPEQAPRPAEYQPTPVTPEELPTYQPERGIEPTHETSPERSGASAPVTPVVTPVQLPTPVFADPAADTTQTTTSDDNPAVAADDDLIEREWVDKAKKIISDTKEDPYRREREVGRLQADYLKKRYGKDVGEAT